MFTYRPLIQGDREIRLLRFTCAATGPFDDTGPISLELQHVSLNDVISYSAVSYTWGSTAASIEIEMNGSPFKITQNLYEALQQFRRDGITSWLWIDAICIEQSNDLEKAWQIMEMREIFGRAKTVYLWLGTGTVESDLAMDFISRVGPRAKSCDATILWKKRSIKEETASHIEERASREACGNTPSESKLGRFIYDLLNEDALLVQSPLKAGITNILRRDYWHRIWVIQEVVLAKEPLVVVGTKSLPLEVFDATFIAIWYCIDLLPSLIRQEWAGFGAALPGTLYRIKSLDIRRYLQQHPSGKPMRLVDILWEGSGASERPHYTATDSRDILFGLLGILDEEQTQGICVDYSKSTADVFTILTRALISSGDEHHNFFRLDCCMPREINGHLPTWVPDWREIGMYGVQVYPINHRRTFNAADGLSAQIPALSVEKDKNVLHRFGCRVDVITQVMDPPEWVQTTPYSASVLEDADSWFQSIAAFTGLGSESGPGEDYVWRTVMRNTFDKNIHVPRQTRVSISNETHHEVEFIHYGPLLSGFGSTSQAVSDEKVALFASRWRWTLGAQNRNRTLFKTSKGMLGLGHVGMETGDIVTLIWSVDSPIILRERPNGGFYFRGDAYVDGIMQGEYLENDPMEEEFCIY
ncbi:Heterokaryon incompatibility [Fusarium albosuccineum]|uniref:Heterokaryon incompatibility n=1 Tax=Fusarium albosuccineum TaxID=1237068 RepID=A0A8H4LHD9_9HYPO|nr:Heterokaryon incompatibility [Fusarium albosuccineum]